MNRFLLSAGLLGATAVALGAWAAHGLEGTLVDLEHKPEGIARRVDNFTTGARYQLAAALACLAVGVAPAKLRNRLGVAAACLAAGAVVFCGLLYAIALGSDAWRWLGAIVPIGGLSMIIGWALIAIAGVRASDDEESQTAQATEHVRLEELLTHQQRLWQELDESLAALRDQSDDSARRVLRLEDAARQLYNQQQTSEELPDERPPHY